MEAAPAAIPVKPKTAAINATTRNMIVQRNIVIVFRWKNICNYRLTGYITVES